MSSQPYTRVTPLGEIVDVAPCEFTIRRDSVVADGFYAVQKVGKLFKQKCKITFLDANGMVEDGIDLGGVFKEFLETLAQEAFRPNYGLFATTADGCYFPTPRLHQIPDLLPLMTFLGRVCAKALYDGILINANFAPFFLAKWVGQSCCLSDLEALDPVTSV
jgi:ubiquitin-protein ligase E3 C